MHVTRFTGYPYENNGAKPICSPNIWRTVRLPTPIETKSTWKVRKCAGIKLRILGGLLYESINIESWT